MYTIRNFKTKKALREAVANYLATGKDPVRYYQPGPFADSAPRNGSITLEGPHFPEPHRWYARAIAKDGIIIEVKK